VSHYERLSALDASFLDVEDTSTHMHVAGTMLFDARPLTDAAGALAFDRIYQLVESRLHLIPRYRQRLAYVPFEGHPVWVDDARFNLHYHLRHTALPPPGSVRVLKRLCGRILSQKLDRTKPLWELWVVEGIEGGRFALISKIHHCVVDGLSGVDIAETLMNLGPDGTIEPPPTWRPRQAPSGAELALDAIGRRALTPLRLLRQLGTAAADPRGTMTSARETLGGLVEAFGDAVSPASETPLNQPIGPHRRYDWLRLDLEEIRTVKRWANATVNDVVLAVVVGGIRRFLERRGTALDGLDFRAMVPVSLRPQGERGRLGNRVAQLIAHLPVDERDPLVRLHKVAATMRRLKQSKQARAGELIEELADWTSTTLLSGVERLATRRRAYNLIVTNVPGSPLPLHLLEAPLLEAYPMVPLFHNQGVGIALVSYAGGLHWGVSADWDAIVDLHDLIGALAAEFEVLKRLTVPEEATVPVEGEGDGRALDA
jgi:diacylglycerol O-acyltransferase / wax synthase